MPLAKSKNQVGLGNSLMNDRFGKGKGQDMRRAKGVVREAPDGSTYITTEKQEAAWVKMRSVTEQPALDEFLSTAELAGTDFTAEKMNNVRIIHRDQKNPYLLSAAEERATLKKQNARRKHLTVPRRPPWDADTSKSQLEQRERESLLDWRRGLAELQERDDLLMTPFERNLEVWRQLWRVIERSDLVVQIVDARNPLLFRSDDLENYVKEVNSKKNNLLLVNKADMMTLEQRQLWAAYFKRAGISFRFFSAELAKDINASRQADADMIADEREETPANENQRKGSSTFDLAHSTHKMTLEEQEKTGREDFDIAGRAEGSSLKKDNPEEDDDDEDEEDEEDEDEEDDDDDDDDDDDNQVTDYEEDVNNDSDDYDGSDERIKILRPEPGPANATSIITTEDLEALFLQHAPEIDTGQDGQTRKTTIGLVGYPNVGKSSTINALIGAKKVSVSATPGKTKHFQTIHLSDQVILCDCPGLVFPNFANTKAELVCNGVLPIDQLREYSGPATLVAQRIPQTFLEAIYGMKIMTRPLEEGGTGRPTGEELLRAFASARGFSTQGVGAPDESRAARYILKDYVKGKLLFCHPPPTNPPIAPLQFNQGLYDASRLPEKRKGQISLCGGANSEISYDASTEIADTVPLSFPQGQKTQAIDKRFFGPGSGNDGHMTKPLHQQLQERATASGKELTGRKLKTIAAIERNVEISEVKTNSKKHFKGNKRKQQKSRSEYV